MHFLSCDGHLVSAFSAEQLCRERHMLGKVLLLGTATPQVTWTAGGPLNGSADTATFATSNITGVSISAFTEATGVVFNAGASVVHNHRQHHEAVDH